MKNSKIVQLLKEFSKEEIFEFGKFVKSPYHNQRNDLIKFYSVLKKYFPITSDNFPVKEQVFCKLYPSKKYNPSIIDRLSSFLYKLGKDFLIISSFKNNRIEYGITLLKEIDTRNYGDEFEKEFGKFYKTLEKEYINENYFLAKSRLENTRIDFYLHRHKQNLICDDVLKRADDITFDFFWIMANNYADMKFNKTSFNCDYEDNYLNILIDCIDLAKFKDRINSKKNPFQNYLYYNYYRILSLKYPDNPEFYQKLKEHSFIGFEKLNNEQKTSRFLALNNYCIFQSMNGNSKFMYESFLNHKEALEKNYLSHILTEPFNFLGFFKNFIAICLTCGEHDYVNQMISEYSKYLPEALKEETINLAKAHIYIETKEYQKAKECLNTASYQEFRNYLEVKLMFLRISYETNDFTSFFSTLDSLKHFIKKKSLIYDYTKTTYITYLNYLNRLFKLKLEPDAESLSILKQTIEKDYKIAFYHKIILNQRVIELENVNKNN